MHRRHLASRADIDRSTFDQEATMPEDAQTSTTDDMAALRRRVAELEQQLDQRAQREAALQDEIWIMQSVLDAIPHAIFWKDHTLVYRGCNQRFADDIGIAGTREIV